MEFVSATGTPSHLEDVRERFERWRRNREKRSPIPETLWEAAASLYPEHSLHEISKALRLNHTKLKHYAMKVSSSPPMAAGQHFIQLGLAPPGSRYVIDMQHQNGSRMTINGADHPDLMKLAGLFWSRP